MTRLGQALCTAFGPFSRVWTWRQCAMQSPYWSCRSQVASQLKHSPSPWPRAAPGCQVSASMNSPAILCGAKPRIITHATGHLRVMDGHMMSAGNSMRGSVRMYASLEEDIRQKNADNKVMVYAKSYCPYCASVISLFEDLQVDAKVVQLDQIGATLQLLQLACCATFLATCCKCCHAIAGKLFEHPACP